jgi:flagellar hook-length control protein FliK
VPAVPFAAGAEQAAVAESASETEAARPESPSGKIEAAGDAPVHLAAAAAPQEANGQQAALEMTTRPDHSAAEPVPLENERASERSAPSDGPAAASTPSANVDAPPPPAPPPAPAVAAVPVAAASAPAASTTTGTSSGAAPASAPQTEAIARTGRRAGEVASATRGERSAEAQSARLLHRVARAFAAAQQRDGEIQLRLSPPELGSLRLRVHVSDGAVTARLEVETAAAQAALTDNLPQLRERLAEQGLRIDRFEVDLLQQQTGGLPDRSQEPEPRQPQAPRPGPAPRAAIEPTTPPRTPGTTAGPGRLNVIV